MPSGHELLLERIRNVSRLQSVGQLLDWDQETYMPRGGLAARAEQMSLLAGLAHEHLVSDETRRLLDQAGAADEDTELAANVRETRRAYDRAARVPTDLVKKIAHESTLAKEAWVRARAESRFEHFAPRLRTLIDLKKQVADRIGYDTEPYDALMDEFEPGAKARDVEALFEELRAFTVDMLRRIQSAPRKPDPSILERSYDRAKQEALSRSAAESLGFDFERGRADVSVHPFCTTIGGGGDVRITTRYDERFLPAALFGTMHEVGHALYEQGLLAEHRFTPMGEAASLGIHESQSRTWENLVGRSRPFWVHHFPKLRGMFPEALRDVSLDQFHGAINAVRPSLIRVEADEVTYNLHIILRFEIERALFTGALDVNGIPAAWNEKMRSSLGVAPPGDADGCLQDIHWSLGGFGYFPTYTLGNLYAAQFMEKARTDLPTLDDSIAANDHNPLLNWLRTNIHRHGRRYRPGELVRRVTGRELSIDAFRRYVTAKFLPIHGLA